MQSIGEGFKSIFGEYGIQMHFKENRTFKNILVPQKYKDPVGQ